MGSQIFDEFVTRQERGLPSIYLVNPALRGYFLNTIEGDNENALYKEPVEHLALSRHFQTSIILLGLSGLV